MVKGKSGNQHERLLGCDAKLSRINCTDALENGRPRDVICQKTPMFVVTADKTRDNSSGFAFLLLVDSILTNSSDQRTQIRFHHPTQKNCMSC